MKIKQHGILNLEAWKLDVICKYCHAVITLEKPEDMYADSRPTGKMDGIYVDYGPKTYHFICPECNHVNKVASKSIRDDIKEKIKFKK